MKFEFYEQLENKLNLSSATKPIKHYARGTLKRDRQKLKLPNCSRKFQRHRIQNVIVQRSECVRAVYKGQKSIVNNFVNICEHLSKKIIVHGIYGVHKPTL